MTSIRDGFHTVTPYLFIKHAEPVFHFIKQAFGAVETYKALQLDGRVKHAEFRIGDSMIMAAETPLSEPAMPCHVHLYIDDPDSFYLRALNAGGVSVMEPTDRTIGERLAGVKDPAGNVWWMSSPIKTP